MVCVVKLPATTSALSNDLAAAGEKLISVIKMMTKIVKRSLNLPKFRLPQ